MNSRLKKFLSYYKPYLGVFLSVMLCSVTVAGISLILPMLTRYIIKTLSLNNLNASIDQIFRVGFIMLGLILIQMVVNFYIDYKGHAMGAMMERDMRNELFQHYQKLSLRFYDEQKTGKLMARITNDLLNLAELYHHGPEDYVIYFINLLVHLLSC